MRKTAIFRRSPNLFVDIEEKDGHTFRKEMSKRKRGNRLDWNIVPPQQQRSGNGSWPERLTAGSIR